MSSFFLPIRQFGYLNFAPFSKVRLYIKM